MFIKSLESSLEERNYKLTMELKNPEGSAILFKVYSLNFDETRIVKVYEDPVNTSNQRFYIEDISKLANLESEYIVKAYESGRIQDEEDEFFYVILEYIKGASLNEINSELFKESSFSG